VWADGPEIEPSAWEQIAPVMFDERRWAEARDEAGLATALLRVEPPAAVLDLACGPGRHALELARRGYRVTGVDATAAFLETAAGAAAGAGLEVELVHEDMRRFSRASAFDAVLSMATSFGYFADPDDDRRTLMNVVRSLRPGGGLLMELMGKEVVARTLEQRDWREEAGTVLLTEQRVRADWTWVENRLIFLREGGRHELVLSHRLYSAAELSALLLETGFASVQVFGDLSGAPYDEDAVRLVAVAHAPPA
jgi:SAM-dependent methyltransferase